MTPSPSSSHKNDANDNNKQQQQHQHQQQRDSSTQEKRLPDDHSTTTQPSSKMTSRRTDDHDSKTATIINNNNNHTFAPPSTHAILESVTRVTLATLGGGLVGLALQKRQLPQQQLRPQPAAAAASFAKKRTSSSGNGTGAARQQTQRQPPSKGPPHRNSTHNHNIRSRQQPPTTIQHARQLLPRQWALSCCLFCIVLESCRLLQPSNMIYHQILLLQKEQQLQQNDDNDENDSNHTSKNRKETALPVTTRAALGVTDATLGGAWAGGAAAIGPARHLLQPNYGTNLNAIKLNNNGGIGSSLRMMLLGSVLGCLAGTVSAAAMVFEESYRHQQKDEPKTLASDTAETATTSKSADVKASSRQ